MNEIQSFNVQLLTYKTDRQDMGNLQSLAASIREQGIIVPLIVRPATGAAPGEPVKMVIVAGRRRFEAAKLAGLTEVPCVTMPADASAQDIAAIENAHRLDLSPMEKYELAMKLGKDIDPEKALHQLDPAQGKRLASLLNLSLRDTQRIIALGLCRPEVQKLVHERVMPVSIALLTVGLTEKKAASFLEYYRAQRPGYLDAKRYLQANQATKGLQYAPFDTKGCANCPHRDSSPLLFEPLGGDQDGGGGYCFKPSCWQEKYREAKREVQALADKLGVPRAKVLMGGNYYGDKKWVYDPHKARDAGASCLGCKLVTMAKDGKKWIPYCDSSCPNRKDVRKAGSEEREVGHERPSYLSRPELEKLLAEGKPVPPASLREYMDARLDEAAAELFRAEAAKKFMALPVEKLPQLLVIDASDYPMMDAALREFRADGFDGSPKKLACAQRVDLKSLFMAYKKAFAKELELDNMAAIDAVAGLLFGADKWCAKHAPEIIKGLDSLGQLAARALGPVKHPLLGKIELPPPPVAKAAKPKPRKK